MPRKARKLSSCGVYHIMIRGINRMTIFNDDADNLNFLHILDFCADENFIIMAYCLMGNHLHLSLLSIYNASHVIIYFSFPRTIWKNTVDRKSVV